MRVVFPRLALAIALGVGAHVSIAMQDTETDPLPSWNAGAAKEAIVAFVGAATKEGGPNFVPPAERIAEGPGRGWIVVSMKSDWNRVFPFESK